MIRLSSIRPGLFANTTDGGPVVMSAFPCSSESCTRSFLSGVSLNSMGEEGCQEQCKLHGSTHLDQEAIMNATKVFAVTRCAAIFSQPWSEPGPSESWRTFSASC